MTNTIRMGATVRAEADRPVQVTISTEEVSDSRFQLEHGDSAVDLSRSATAGLPVLINHNTTGLPVARATNLKIENGALRGELRFSASPQGQQIEQDIRAGIITDVSVGAEYDPEHATERDDGVTVIQRWRPVEVSVVWAGAIPGAKVAAAKGADNVVSIAMKEIRSLFAAFPDHQALGFKAVTEGWSLDQASAELAKAVAAKAATETPEAPGAPPSTFRAGKDQREQFQAAAEVAVRYRAGAYAPTEAGRAQMKGDAEALRGNELAGLSLVELARESLRRANVDTRGMDVKQVVNLALRGTPETRTVSMAAGHTSSDFTSLITTSAYKLLAAGYDEAPETWRTWTRTVPMSNFQQHRFPNLSAFNDLDERQEGSGYTHGTFSDKHEVATLKEYGKRFAIDRQTIINDDLNAFTMVPMKMGQAAARKVGDLVYAVLTTGTSTNLLETGRALFNATEANLITSGAAPSVTTLNAGMTWMATRTDPSGNATMGTRPRYLIVPVALEATTRALLASQNDPAVTPETPNPFQGAFTLVSDHRLDAHNASGWYLAAAPGQVVETVCVGFLNGRQTPLLEEETTTERPGIIYTVTHDAVAAALDWRGLYYNDGVT